LRHLGSSASLAHRCAERANLTRAGRCTILLRFRCNTAPTMAQETLSIRIDQETLAKLDRFADLSMFKY
jgi:hypothetical protein